VAKVNADFGNPSLGHIPLSVTKDKPANAAQIRETVVVTAGNGSFCNSPFGGTTPADPRLCTTWLPVVSYVFAGDPFYNTNQKIADAIAHEAGHQMGLMHTYNFGDEDIMGVVPREHYLFSGAFPVVQDGSNFCNRVTQDDYARILAEYRTSTKAP
jgi:hypothetical protein